MSQSSMQAILSLKPEQRNRAHEIGRVFRGVELDLTDRLDEREVRATLRACEGANLEVKAVHLPNPKGLGRMTGSRRIPETLLALNDIIFVFHPWMRNKREEESTLERFAESINRSGSRMVIENVSSPKRFLCSSADVNYFLIRRRQFSFCLDTSHAFATNTEQGMETVLAYIKKAADALRHIHISDANSAQRHLPLGKGAIDWGLFFSALRTERYSGLLTLEIGDVGMEDVEDSVERLSRHGVSVDRTQPISLLSASTPETAASLISGFAGEEKAPDELVKLLADKNALFSYSDEHNQFVFFDERGGQYAHALRQLDFPADLPNCQGFIGVMTSAHRMEALYLDRNEKVAVRTTLQDIGKGNGRKKDIGEFIVDIENARRLATNNSILRMCDEHIFI